jgi:small subunit ribosomal protein S6
MREYEAVFIFRAGSDNVTAGKSCVSSEFNNQSITILKEEDLGERAFAYPIKKEERGHYIVYTCKSEPAGLKSLDKTFKLKSEILKYVFFKKDKKQ